MRTSTCLRAIARIPPCRANRAVIDRRARMPLLVDDKVGSSLVLL